MIQYQKQTKQLLRIFHQNYTNYSTDIILTYYYYLRTHRGRAAYDCLRYGIGSHLYGLIVPGAVWTAKRCYGCVSLVRLQVTFELFRPLVPSRSIQENCSIRCVIHGRIFLVACHDNKLVSVGEP